MDAFLSASKLLEAPKIICANLPTLNYPPPPAAPPAAITVEGQVSLQSSIQ